MQIYLCWVRAMESEQSCRTSRSFEISIILLWTSANPGRWSLINRSRRRLKLPPLACYCNLLATPLLSPVLAFGRYWTINWCTKCIRSLLIRWFIYLSLIWKSVSGRSNMRPGRSLSKIGLCWEQFLVRATSVAWCNEGSLGESPKIFHRLS